MTAQQNQSIKQSHDAGLAPQTDRPNKLWVEKLTLSDFRSYAFASLETGPNPVILTGTNGAGKTNILEAISLLSSGQGLRRAPYLDLVRKCDGARQPTRWAVAARVNSRIGPADIGTGLQPAPDDQDDFGNRPTRAGRTVRIDGETQSGPSALNDYLDIVWLTPTMDGLFTGPASERRRFLDRLVYCFDPAFRSLTGRFERATQSRNRLLSDGVRDNNRLEGLEIIMAETGSAIAAARTESVAALQAVINDRRTRDENSPFPWCFASMDGTLEKALETDAAVDVEDTYRIALAQNRERDRAAGRTLEGPHRSDFLVSHGPKDMPARICSTGEQKALLLGLVLAQAELIARRHEGSPPLILLDEISAHLDFERRQALFLEILHLDAQAWMTGTDPEIFAPLSGHADRFTIEQGKIIPSGQTQAQ